MTLSLSILTLSAALAGPFTAKSSQGSLPLAEVKRDLVLPKGWLALSLAHDHKASSQYRDADGQLQDRSSDAVWTYNRTWLRIEQGFSPRVTLYAHIPVVSASLTNNAGANTQTRALGDVHTGLRAQPVLGERVKLGFGIDIKAPSGVEWPSDFIGGSGNSASFLTGTGITNLGIHLKGRWLLGERTRIDAEFGLVQKFAGVVGYVIETGGFGNGWLNPGDEFYLHQEISQQVGERFTVHGIVLSSARGAHQIGVSGASPTGAILDTLEGTEARYIHAGTRAQLSLSEHLDIQVQAIMQVKGTDTRTFAHLGLEELSPQPGRTSTLEVTYRW